MTLLISLAENLGKKIEIKLSLHKCFLPIDNPETENSLLTVALLEVDRELARSFKELKELQKGDPRIAKYMEKNDERSEELFFKMHNDLLLHRKKVSDE